ncbi:MAG TPA: 3-hydroxyacyl-ACP dehydratase FabZ family protein [Planctomycetota bacterium]|jgi:3-hydroxyacyl-[acyl-carrier-protein] dehydratase
MRFILLDRITQWKPGQHGRATKNVALSEDFFDDHFPLKPIMPGALILEGMAQLSGLLLEEGIAQQEGRHVKALMSMVERAKFRSPAKPGDCLEYRADVLSTNELGGKTTAQTHIGESLIAECSLLFSFHIYDNPRLDSRRADVLHLLLKDVARHGC